MPGQRGRPRSKETQRSILNAAYELLKEGGFEAITVEKIAERAKVSKATIYKWWPNKAAVVIDGYLSAASERLPVPDTGSVFEDIAIHAVNVTRFLAGPEGTMITEIVGQGQFDAALAETYRARYFRPRRLEARGLLEKGVRRGELREDLDLACCVDLLYGPILYRLLVTGDPLDEAYVRRLVSYGFEGLRSRDVRAQSSGEAES